MQDKFQYRISQPADDINEAVIEKSGMSSVEFTLGELQKKQNEWSTEKRQLDGQITVEQSKVDNIAHHHPFILDMKEEDQYAVWMYYEAMKTVAELTKQRDIRVSALDEYQAEKEHILQVLGFQKTTI